ncbi:MAG: hypothetical protein WCL30_06980, partial [Pseudomonadota bacterium]
MADQELKKVTLKMSEAEHESVMKSFGDYYTQVGNTFLDDDTNSEIASLEATKNAGEYVFSYSVEAENYIDLFLKASPVNQAIKNNAEPSSSDYLDIPAFLRRQEPSEPEVIPEPKTPLTDDTY